MVKISHFGSGLGTIPEWEAEKKMQVERRRRMQWYDIRMQKNADFLKHKKLNYTKHSER